MHPVHVAMRIFSCVWNVQVITAEALELLRGMLEAGCSLTGCTDATLERLAVLVEGPARVPSP